MPVTREMLEEFNERVTAARRKSQRRGAGSDEKMTEMELALVEFDREKQSPNDGEAIKRQYAKFREYFRALGVRLPDSIEP
jgi:hypothetical protein